MIVFITLAWFNFGGKVPFSNKKKNLYQITYRRCIRLNEKFKKQAHFGGPPSITCLISRTDIDYRIKNNNISSKLTKRYDLNKKKNAWTSQNRIISIINWTYLYTEYQCYNYYKNWNKYTKPAKFVLHNFFFNIDFIVVLILYRLNRH